MKSFLSKLSLCALLVLCGMAASTEDCDCKNFTGTQKEECLKREARYRQEAEERLQQARKLVIGKTEPAPSPSPTPDTQ